jgi:hypothetical protein
MALKAGKSGHAGRTWPSRDLPPAGELGVGEADHAAGGPGALEVRTPLALHALVTPA